MKTSNLIALFFAIILLVSCNDNSKQVTNADDYNSFLEIKTNKSKDFAQGEIDFWQAKFDEAPNQISYLSPIAANYSKLFENTGDIQNLYKAEAALVQSNKAYNYTNVATIRSLGRNYITQHRFKEALVLANKALAIGEGLKETQKLLFDVQMELGNYPEAEKNLTAIKDLKDFDYLIRLSKWSDHIGDLETAISFMEKAKKIAFDNQNKDLKIWTLSNLGDLNGHAGNIQKGYNYYLETLALEPNNCYALKGIAWIVFSSEKNTTEAKRIIDKVSKNHNTPDFYLLRAEIAEFENNVSDKTENLKKYFRMLAVNNYGVMYNKYNVLVYSDYKTSGQKALEIAKEEVANRPTPDSYDLLAWSYFNLGEKQKALEIVQKYVAQKSLEPELNYHVATIYKANNLNDKRKPIKSDLETSLFELGPNMITKIQSL
jgi:hypothetical protein